MCDYEINIMWQKCKIPEMFFKTEPTLLVYELKLCNLSRDVLKVVTFNRNE